MILNIRVLPDHYSIYRFKPGTEIPEWIYSSEFFSITRTQDEISVVTSQTDTETGFLSNRDWRVLKIAGPLDFSLIGIIADISVVLKDKNIPILSISTYDTDYILIKQKDLETGIMALEENGHKIQSNGF
jgi:uncharacterized protein